MSSNSACSPDHAHGEELRTAAPAAAPFRNCRRFMGVMRQVCKDGGRTQEERGSRNLGYMPSSAQKQLRRAPSFARNAAAFRAKDGGADRNRTCDLLIANETLYQLSYDPIPRIVFAQKTATCKKD